jgi:hypothetical protein
VQPTQSWRSRPCRSPSRPDLAEGRAVPFYLLRSWPTRSQRPWAFWAPSSMTNSPTSTHPLHDDRRRRRLCTIEKGRRRFPAAVAESAGTRPTYGAQDEHVVSFRTPLATLGITPQALSDLLPSRTMSPAGTV